MVVSTPCSGSGSKSMLQLSGMVGAIDSVPIVALRATGGTAISIIGPSPTVHFGDRVALIDLNAPVPACLTTSGSVSSVVWQRLTTGIGYSVPVREWQIEAAGTPGSVAAGTPLAPGIQFKLIHVQNPAASLALRTSDSTVVISSSTSCARGLAVQPLLVTFNQPVATLVLQPQPWWLQLVQDAMQLPDWWIEAWAPSWGPPPPWWRPLPHGAFKLCPGGFVVPVHSRCPDAPGPVPICPAHWTKCPDGNCRPPGVRCSSGCPPGQFWCPASQSCQHVGTWCHGSGPLPPPPPPPPPSPPTPCPPGSKPCPGGCCPFGAPCPAGQILCNGHCQSGGIRCLPQPSITCPPGQQRCPDGKCQPAGTHCAGGSGPLPFIPPAACPPGSKPCPGGCCPFGAPPSLGRVDARPMHPVIPTPFTPFRRA